MSKSRVGDGPYGDGGSLLDSTPWTFFCGRLRVRRAKATRSNWKCCMAFLLLRSNRRLGSLALRTELTTVEAELIVAKQEPEVVTTLGARRACRIGHR